MALFEGQLSVHPRIVRQRLTSTCNPMDVAFCCTEGHFAHLNIMRELVGHVSGLTDSWYDMIAIASTPLPLPYVQMAKVHSPPSGPPILLLLLLFVFKTNF